MKITCNIIRDVLPLYLEDMVSHDTRSMVDEHLAHCEECRKEVDGMGSNNSLPIDVDISPLKKIKATLRRKKLQAVITSIMLTLIICFVTIAFLTAPEYLPYKDGIVSFIKSDGGPIIVKFSDEVSGYDINKYSSKIDGAYVYHITTWNSIWNKNIRRTTPNTIVLNPNGESIDSIYYYTTDGSEDKLVYGRNQHVNGGVVTLPRLFLSYYLLTAMVLTILFLLILVIFRKHKKTRNRLWRITFLPISYILAHLLIKGLVTTSYSATRDFYGIILATIPLYIIFLLIFNLFAEYKGGKHSN